MGFLFDPKKARSEFDFDVVVRGRILAAEGGTRNEGEMVSETSPESLDVTRPGRLVPTDLLDRARDRDRLSMVGNQPEQPSRMTLARPVKDVGVVTVVAAVALVAAPLLFLGIANRSPDPIRESTRANLPMTGTADSSSGFTARSEGVAANRLAPAVAVDVSGLDPPIVADVRNQASSPVASVETAGAQGVSTEPEAGRISSVRPPPGFTGAILRDAPSTRGASMRVLASGALIEVLKESATGDGFIWLHVRTDDGLVGWVVSTAVR